MNSHSASPIAPWRGMVVWLCTRVFRSRPLIMLFTLEASAATNLVTSLAGSANANVTRTLLAVTFFVGAAAYASATEGILQFYAAKAERREIIYEVGISERAGDLAWWLGAQACGVIYGTLILWLGRS